MSQLNSPEISNNFYMQDVLQVLWISLENQAWWGRRSLLINGQVDSSSRSKVCWPPIRDLGLDVRKSLLLLVCTQCSGVRNQYVFCIQSPPALCQLTLTRTFVELFWFAEWQITRKRNDKTYFKSFKTVPYLDDNYLEANGWAVPSSEALEQLSGLIWVRDEQWPRG